MNLPSATITHLLLCNYQFRPIFISPRRRRHVYELPRARSMRALSCRWRVLFHTHTHTYTHTYTHTQRGREPRLHLTPRNSSVRLSLCRSLNVYTPSFVTDSLTTFPFSSANTSKRHRAFSSLIAPVIIGSEMSGK